jgi:hypothetical protein
LARNSYGIRTFLRHVVPGMLAGVVLGTLAAVLHLTLSATRFDAHVVLFHSPGSGLSDSARDFIAATLARDKFLRSAVAQHGWDAEIASYLASNLSVIARGGVAGPIAELHLVGSDEATTKTTLEAIAMDMIRFHRTRQKAELQNQLTELHAAVDIAQRDHQALGTAGGDDRQLPTAAQIALDSSVDIVTRKREIELGRRFRLRSGSAFEDAKQVKRLESLARIQERLYSIIEENSDFG